MFGAINPKRPLLIWRRSVPVYHAKKYTGEKAKHRKERQVERQKHIEALKKNEVTEELPAVLLPDIFQGIQET